MLLQGDAKALEVVVAAYLSQDKIMMAEIISGADMHADNMKMLKLPSRLVAKVFVFRTLYGGGAYSFAHDANFAECRLNEKRWQVIIDTFYEKYEGLRQWHIKIVQDVIATGKLVMPTGRIFDFEPILKGGELVYPITLIKNYPVQSGGADLMALARVSFFNKLKKLDLKDYKLVNTVHDSIVIDTAENNIELLCSVLHQTFKDLPGNFHKLFGVEFNLPIVCTIDKGMNWKDMELISNNA